MEKSSITDKSIAASSFSACSLDQILSGQCSASSGQIVTSTMGSDVTTWINVGSGTTVTASIPTGYYQAKQCSFEDLDLTPANIANGANIFGTAGIYTGTFSINMASSAPRDPGVKVVFNLSDLTSTSAQLSLNHENTTYASADFPTTGGYNYRDIPDINQDDDGISGTNCKYARRPSVDCGTSQATIALRVGDCQTANPTTSSWDGASQCNGGQGLWRLVSRNGANKEVWQDQRTGLLWSSVVNTLIDWCRAAGNVQLTPLAYLNSYNLGTGMPIVGNGTIGSLASGTASNTETITVTFSNATTFTVAGTSGAGGCQGGSTVGVLTTTAGSTSTYSDVNECSFTITQGAVNFAANDTFRLQSANNASYSCAAGGPLQPASPLSYCAEAIGLNSDAGENWGTGSYFAAKGGLGKNSTPGVRWRLPSDNDYKTAEVNGIRYIMPDMGGHGNNRPSIDGSDGSIGGAAEWTSTLTSLNRDAAKGVSTDQGTTFNANRSTTYGVRCVGR